MSKRLAGEALGDEFTSPASKRRRDDSNPGYNDSAPRLESDQNGAYHPSITMLQEGARTADREENGMDIDGYEEEDRSMATTRQEKEGPIDGYDDLYLDTIDRYVYALRT